MLPSLVFSPDPAWFVPDEAGCAALWDKYGMPPHIRAHCRTVAQVATRIAERALDRGLSVDMPLLRAAALLHDLAKPYSIRHGGGHAQLGAAWVRDETGNPALAQAVLFHVHWPWDEGPLAPEVCPVRLPLIVSYADKRARHDEVVSLEERFADLLERYGKTEVQRELIRKSCNQALRHEAALTALLGTL